MNKKDIILKAENISKQYRLGTVGTGTLSHDLNRWWHAIRGKEDPYLKVGEVNDRSSKGTSEYVWALQDINFEVERGEVLGIIGKNGAGKSTLLKILSKVTAPTTGTIKSRGRIASLLEVGTGFNPELTGRENIYLNGAILGMTKKEITSKLDEIIAFSGCERYIDTPTKRYSSGMTVRLAFAVAAFLEPEILVVDEVLAVGDAEFQKKAIGKMQDISKSEGRTVLFVSHNLASIKMLCKNSILLSNGKLIKMDKTDIIINDYKNLMGNLNGNAVLEFENTYLKLVNISYSNEINGEAIAINNDIYITIEIDFKEDLLGIAFEMFLKNNEDLDIFTSITSTTSIKKGINKIECFIPKNILNNETYFITFGVSKDYNVFIAKFENAIKLDVENYIETFGWQGKFEGVVRPKLQWKINNNNVV